MFQDTELD